MKKENEIKNKAKVLGKELTVDHGNKYKSGVYNALLWVLDALEDKYLLPERTTDDISENENSIESEMLEPYTEEITKMTEDKNKTESDISTKMTMIYGNMTIDLANSTFEKQKTSLFLKIKQKFKRKPKKIINYEYSLKGLLK